MDEEIIKEKNIKKNRGMSYCTAIAGPITLSKPELPRCFSLDHLLPVFIAAFLASCEGGLILAEPVEAVSGPKVGPQAK
jgi:hypothetical protein